MARFLCAWVTLGSLLGTSASAAGADGAAPAPQDCPPGATSSRRYAAILGGNRAGYQTSCLLGDGSRQILFEFNDRGRGPKTTTRLVLNARGLPASIETTGTDYLKNPASESFAAADGKARWKNKAEAGEAAAGNAFYVSYSGAPEETALLAAALLAAPGGSLPLLPAGQARIERAGERIVEAGGRSQTVGHYEISGLGFAPTDVWLDADRRLFATVSPWFTLIAEGWEPVAESLLAAQQERVGTRETERARRLAHRPSGALAFRGAAVFDAETGRLRPRTTVVVSGGTIQAVGPDGSVTVPEGAEVVEAAGMTLLPGLWDMHVHLDDNDGLLHMAAGVTSVRDLANDIDSLLERRRHFDAGDWIGPRVVLAGIIDGKGPFQGPTKMLVDSEDEARAAVRRYASLGYEQIKIYSSVKPELVPAIVDEAHKHELRVSGHIPAFMSAEQAVRAGFDEIQHINMLVLNFLFDTVKDTRTPARFTAVAENAATMDFGSERVQSFLRLLKERHVVVDPTVAVFEGMFVDRPGSVSRSYAAVADRLPPQVRRGLLNGGLPVPEGMDQRYRDSFTALLRLVRQLHDTGVTLVAGTDGLAGFTLHRELELYVEAGLPAPTVLQIATLGAARVMGREGRLGTIAPGKLADLILVEGDPTAHISDIRRVRTVVKDGTVYSAADLYREVGVQP